MPGQVTQEAGKGMFSTLNEAREFMVAEEKVLAEVANGAAEDGDFSKFNAQLGLDEGTGNDDAMSEFVTRQSRFQEGLSEWNGKWLPLMQAQSAMSQPPVIQNSAGRYEINPLGNQQPVQNGPFSSPSAGVAAVEAAQTPVPLVEATNSQVITNAQSVAGEYFVNSAAYRRQNGSVYQHGDGMTPWVPIPVNLNEFLAVGQSTQAQNYAIADTFLADQRRQLTENNLMLTTDGVPPESTRTGRWVADEQIQPRFMDIIPQFATTQENVVWMHEDDITYAAREVAEAGDYPEENLGGYEVQVRVRDVATMVNVTAQQIADVSFVRSYVMASLGASMRQRLSRQLLRGSAQNVTMKGMWAYTGEQSESTPSERDGIGEMVYSDSNDDKLVLVIDALTRVMENSGGRAEPNRIVMTPRAWFKTITDLDSNNNFRVWGPNQQGARTLWSTSVVLTQEFQRLTDMLVGDFSIANCGFALREGLSMQTTDSHRDNFSKRIITIRAQMRGAMCVFRESAFIKLGTSAGDLSIAETQNAYTL